MIAAVNTQEPVEDEDVASAAVDVPEPQTVEEWSVFLAARDARQREVFSALTCEKAAMRVAAYGERLLVWFDAERKFQMLRIPMSDPLPREFIPDYARRRSEVARPGP